MHKANIAVNTPFNDGFRVSWVLHRDVCRWFSHIYLPHLCPGLFHINKRFFWKYKNHKNREKINFLMTFLQLLFWLQMKQKPQNYLRPYKTIQNDSFDSMILQLFLGKSISNFTCNFLLMLNKCNFRKGKLEIFNLDNFQILESGIKIY